MHPFHYQELEHLETILRCGNNESTTGKLIQASLEALKLELGLPDSWAGADYSLLGGCTTASWLKSVWKYCWEHNLEITDPTPSLTLRRAGDKFLMEAFTQQNKWNAE